MSGSNRSGVRSEDCWPLSTCMAAATLGNEFAHPYYRQDETATDTQEASDKTETEPI